MKDGDEAVDRVLAGIREADVPGGLEDRVLRAVRQREAHGTKPRFFGSLFGGMWPPKPRAWVFASGFAGVLAVVLLCASVYRFGGRSELARQEVAVRPAVPAAAVIMAPIDPVAAEHPPGFLHGSKSLREPGTRGVEAERLAGSLSVSYPAPPMPLTEQERLLLRVAHKGDSVEMAMLDGVRWRGELAEGQAEFQRFFKPVPPADASTDQRMATSTATGDSK